MTTDQTTGTAPRVRRADESDLAAVERLLVESSLPTDGVNELLDDFVVAQAGDTLVGVAGLEVCCDNALLRSVAVAPEWRSHGVGRTLVTRLIADAEARGVNALYLLTTSADQYFPSFGFRAVSRDEVPDDIRATSQFSGGCCSTATVMCRECA
jgi:amino-acid N-acetyltransferase